MNTGITVYVLHKQGAKTHYTGLDYLLKQHGGQVVYREFSIFGRFFKSLFKGELKRAGKQVTNAGFMLGLLFSKNKRVVLGIAPFDPKLGRVLWFLRGHKVFYHNSWTVWDGSYHPKSKGVTPKVMARWKRFLEQDVQHIFAVSGETKKQIAANYAVNPENISVVYHSYNAEVFHFKPERTPAAPGTFVYAGRLLPEKGLEELLAYFAVNPDKTFTVIGKGHLQAMVKEYAQKHANIHFTGYISNPILLAEQYRSHRYVALNSVKTAKWEEAFGMVLIEAMACGAVPVATRHTGPMEIIENGINGYLVEEGALPGFLSALNDENHATLQEQALITAQQFTRQAIAQRWQPVLR